MDDTLGTGVWIWLSGWLYGVALAIASFCVDLSGLLFLI